MRVASGDRLRVLLVAFYFPPTTGGGVQRALSFARHLPTHGVDVEVMAPTDARWVAADAATLADVPDGLRVHRVAFRGPDKRVLPADRIRQARGARRVAVRVALAPQRLLVPDTEVVWLCDALPVLRRQVATGRFAAVLTTAPPHSVSLLGAAVRRASLPWIADWRDPWLSHPDLRRDARLVRAKLRVAGAVAGRVARRMDAATVTTQAAAEVRRLAPGCPVVVVDNGIEPEAFAGAPPAVPSDRFELVFCGYFFGDRRPAPLLSALAALFAARPELRGVVSLRFVGGFPSADRDLVSTLGLADAVRVDRSVPHADAIRLQRAAGANILFMQADAGRGDAFVPQKTYEQIAAGRPVLALVAPHGAAATLLRTHARCFVAHPDDQTAVTAALAAACDAFLAERPAVGRRPSNDVIASWSRETRAGLVADVIRSVTAGRANA
jgi:glycosyltransferase involved in cell wall biosynthesis